MLSAETGMFDKYLKRVEPKDGQPHHHPTQPLTTTPSHSTHDLVGASRMGRKRSKSRSSNMDRTLRLNAEQKCDIAQREIEEYREEIDRLREESEKVLDNFKVYQSIVVRSMLSNNKIIINCRYHISLRHFWEVKHYSYSQNNGHV